MDNQKPITHVTDSQKGKIINGCNVNSTFNNTVGLVAIAAFCFIAYIAYNYFKK